MENTAELRQSLLEDYSNLRDGKLTNASARARVAVARGILETIKVELAAATLGRTFEPVDLRVTKAKMRAVA